MEGVELMSMEVRVYVCLCVCVCVWFVSRISSRSDISGTDMRETVMNMLDKWKWLSNNDEVLSARDVDIPSCDQADSSSHNGMMKPSGEI